MENAILCAIERCKQESARKESILDYNSIVFSGELKNQFMIMIKPECLSIEDNVDAKAIISKFLEMLREYKVTINAISAMNGTFLKNNRLIEQQYAVLNNGARYGMDSIPEGVSNEIRQKYNGYIITGAYPFLQEQPNFSERSLEKISHKAGSIKIGNGTYLLLLDHSYGNYGIINAFHPHQVSHFNDGKSVILTFICSSDTEYNILSSELIGFFNPEKAKKSSLRYFLFSNSSSLRLKDIGVFLNGFHISPSPLEGMFAVMRYCNDEKNCPIMANQTYLGSRLISSGFTDIQIQNLARNPYINYCGDVQSIYSICEDKNVDFVLDLLIKNKTQLDKSKYYMKGMKRLYESD